MAGDKHDLSYYVKCITGGMFACGLTHTAIVPLEKTHYNLRSNSVVRILLIPSTKIPTVRFN